LVVKNREKKMKFILIYFEAVFAQISDSSFNWRYGIFPDDAELGHSCSWDQDT